MATLETLPAPLPLDITKHLADLKALHALRVSVPLFGAVFTLHAVEIFEHVMLNSLCGEVIVNLRAYILLLTRSDDGTQPSTHSELQDLYTAAQTPLARNVPASIIGHTIHVFAKLSTTCDRIFEEKLQRLYALPHHRLADITQASHLSDNRRDLHLQPARLYTLPPESPADWDEQQRMLRGIWRLKIWETVKIYRPGHVPWVDFPAFTWKSNCNPTLLFDEMEEMATSLNGAHISETIAWKSPARKPIVETENQRQQAQLDKILPPGESFGYFFFRHTCARWAFSPLRGTDWVIMRSLGFGIWSNRRLRELRLKSTSSPIRNISVEEERFKEQQRLEQPELFQEGEDLDLRDLLFTWNAHYRAAAGESIRMSNALV